MVVWTSFQHYATVIGSITAVLANWRAGRAFERWSIGNRVRQLPLGVALAHLPFHLDHLPRRGGGADQQPWIAIEWTDWWFTRVIALRNGDPEPPEPQFTEITIEVPSPTLWVQGNQGAVGGQHST
ncbi:hypothetical protein NUU61_005265 [Penicillium alfredii]|uniref:Uncharacterized protein n=1 Tax=Penicillium alfredii TaxID=1506179 RepID=A0A9W9K7F9_9EURO|nr:uncharacterized protein NUU61_005265 [Penicillium alfredii]KAJ5095909.1 hypothetical protein NUU61_005265 [Penicillium alfredii]